MKTTLLFLALAKLTACAESGSNEIRIYLSGECGVCLEMPNSFLTKCGHVICDKCFDTVKSARPFDRCPICREELSTCTPLSESDQKIVNEMYHEKNISDELLSIRKEYDELRDVSDFEAIVIGRFWRLKFYFCGELTFWELMYKKRWGPDVKVEVWKAIAQKQNNPDLNIMWAKTLESCIRLYASLWTQYLKKLQEQIESRTEHFSEYIEGMEKQKIKLLKGYEAQILKIRETDRAIAYGIVRARVDMMHLDSLKWLKDSISNQNIDWMSAVANFISLFVRTDVYIHKRLAKYEELGLPKTSDEEWIKLETLINQLFLHGKYGEFEEKMYHGKTEDELFCMPATEQIEMMEFVLGLSS